MPPSAKLPSTQSVSRDGVEPGDVNFKGVVLFFVGLAIGMVVVHLVVSSFFLKLKRDAIKEDEQLSHHDVAASVAASHPYFPAPHEQIAPELDLEVWRAQQTTELNSYGWVDRNTGVVRIPIERAMELISQRGLPTRQGSNASFGPSSLDLQSLRPVESSPPAKEEGR